MFETTDHYKFLDRELDRLLDLNSEQRRERLAEIGERDPDTRNRLAELLAATELSRDFFARPVPEAAERLFASAAWQQGPLESGALVGAYRVVEVLGQGGMGIVYLAERADGQFEQTVALKVLQRGLRGESFRQRFLAERQLLAKFDHRHIARLFDGGLTEAGTPYLVMERVRGEPIDTYCEQQDLSIRQRLELFLQACEAVAYAHSHLVVHRDLKPANILVNRLGELKLLDFGVAAVLDAPGYTETDESDSALLMTPEYGAPEQLETSARSMSSDIYSLGVVLYELLTGQRPYRIQGDTAELVLRSIREATIEPPSKVGSFDLGDLAASDLDAIVLEAISFQPEDRYPSVEALRRDLLRCLDRRPVEVRPATAGYLLHRWLARHRQIAILAGLLIVALLGGTIATWTQAREAQRERDQARTEARTARRLLDLTVELVRSNDPANSPGGELTVAELFSSAAAKIDQELTDQPHEQATLLAAIGEVYSGLGHVEQSRRFLERSVDLRRQAGQEMTEAHIRGLQKLSEGLRNLGEYQAAAPLFEEMERLLPQILPAEHPERGVYEQAIGNWYIENGEPELGRQHLLACLRLARLRRLTLREAHCLNDLASSGLFTTEERAPLQRRAIALFEEAGQPQAPNVLITRSNYALSLHNLGDYAGAEAEYQVVLGLQEEVLGAEHSSIGETLSKLGALLLDSGHFADAAASLQRATALLEAGGHDRQSIQWLAAQINLARCQLEITPDSQVVGRLQELEQLLIQGFSTRPLFITLGRLRVGEGLLAIGRPAAARAKLEGALAAADENSLSTTESDLRLALGSALLELGQAEQALPLLAEAARKTSTKLPINAWRRGLATAELGACRLALGDTEAGQLLLVEGIGVLAAARGEDDWRVERARRQLARAPRG